MNRMMKRIFYCLMVVFSMVVLSRSMTVYATQAQTPKAQLYIEGYEVTNESIMPGTEFTLTIKMKNYSKEASAEEVVVSVSNPEGIVPEYGTVSMAYIEKIEPNTSAEVKFNYTANADIRSSELNFNVTVGNANSATGAQLRIPVGRLTDFEVEKSTIPESMTAGKTSYASVMVENIGDSACYDVSMVARCDGKDLFTAQIGSISAGKTRTQSLGLVFEVEGVYEVDILLTYVNAEGESKEYLISSNSIKVTEDLGNSVAASDQDTEQQESPVEGDSSRSIIIICISGILLISICCVVLMLLYRRK